MLLQEPDELPIIFYRRAFSPRARRVGAARGLYRVFNAAAYRFYRSNSTPPAEGDTPFATSATLPHTPADTYVDGTWYLSVSYFNGVIDSGFLPIGSHGETYRVIEIAAGALVPTRPSGPTDARLAVGAGGVIQIIAFYARQPDGASAGTEWAITYTTNGSTPAAGAPTVAVLMPSGPLAILVYNLPAQTNGTIVKVRLQTRRGDVYSLPGSVMTATATNVGPTSPLAAGVAPEGA